MPHGRERFASRFPLSFLFPNRTIQKGRQSRMIAPAADTAFPISKQPTPAEIMREAMNSRRRPLRGKALVALARMIGLDWADTGTGHPAGTVFLSGDKVTRYLVMETGAFVRVDVVDGRLWPATQKLTKKQRNRLKTRPPMPAKA